MYCADEAFFTGTAAEVTPIRELNDRIIGDGKRGPVTESLHTIFFATVSGRSQQHARWLTAVAPQ
jgi:branched-chain amino acid aminotransferase